MEAEIPRCDECRQSGKRGKMGDDAKGDGEAIFCCLCTVCVLVQLVVSTYVAVQESVLNQYIRAFHGCSET